MERDEFYRRARTDLPGPLAGVVVLDVTKVWSGPMASGILADLGADVIRVELPGGRDGEVPPAIPGTGLSWFRQTVNRNKRSIALDLRTPSGRDVFLQLARQADVIVENYRPGTLDEWGVGYEACRAVREDTVMVSISGYGQYGPRSRLPGYDPVVQAHGGWMALNGEPSGGALRSPTFIADDLAGLYGAVGALAALRHRDAVGEGQHVDVAMLDSLLAGSSGLLSLAAAGAPPPRLGNQTDFVVPADTYTCQEGEVYLAVALNRQWRALAEAMGRPELARAEEFGTAEARLRHRDEVNEAVAAWCATLPAGEVAKILEACAVPASVVRDLTEVAADPDLRIRDMLQDVTLHNGSTAPLTGPAVKFSRTPTRIRRGAPAPGADTAAVLREFGVRSDEAAS